MKLLVMTKSTSAQTQLNMLGLKKERHDPGAAAQDVHGKSKVLGAKRRCPLCPNDQLLGLQSKCPLCPKEELWSRDLRAACLND